MSENPAESEAVEPVAPEAPQPEAPAEDTNGDDLTYVDTALQDDEAEAVSDAPDAG